MDDVWERALAVEYVCLTLPPHRSLSPWALCQLQHLPHLVSMEKLDHTSTSFISSWQASVSLGTETENAR